MLTTQTPPEEREAWYERQLKAGVQVFIGHPRLVQTGLDYVEYGGCRELFSLKQVNCFATRIGLQPSLSLDHRRLTDYPTTMLRASSFENPRGHFFDLASWKG